eukprot:m.26598 g.26598  ORF g.26598 m.26598 type:complete len:93 (+) comp8947_c1_seq1:127-405(+)
MNPASNLRKTLFSPVAWDEGDPLAHFGDDDLVSGVKTLDLQTMQADLERVTACEQMLKSEFHEKRKKDLKKLLTEIESTQWQYPPIEKLIGM